MYRTESITNNLLEEVDSLIDRMKNIKKAFLNTSHNGLRERLFLENKTIFHRLDEIFSIAKALNKRNNEKISFNSLLLEKCRRTIYQTKMEKNLFFL